MKIKLSKSQWEGIGKKAGWVKISKLMSEQTIDQIQEDVIRLEQINEYLKRIGGLLDLVRASEIPMVEEGNILMRLYKNVGISIKILKRMISDKTNK